MNCCRGTCEATAAHFDRKAVEADLRRSRTKGLDTRARRLVDALVQSGIEGVSILDVGSGAGMISIELLQRGAASATLADVSPAYLEVARDLATEKSLVGRIRRRMTSEPSYIRHERCRQQLETAGLRRAHESGTLAWKIEVYSRRA